MAASAAWGVVAFESLNQDTSFQVPTCSRRCGGPVNDASADAMASVVPSPVSRINADAASALVMSCGRLRFIVPTDAIEPPGPTRWPSTTR